MTPRPETFEEDRTVRGILGKVFDRQYVVEPTSRECTEYAADRGVLQTLAYDEWMIALARRMHRADAAAFFSRMDLNRIITCLKENGACPPICFRLTEQDVVREYQLIPALSHADGEKLVFLRQELQWEHARPLEAVEALHHSDERLRFLVGHLLENYIEIKVKTGECTMFPASHEKMQVKKTLKEQIAWWAENIIVSEEREAYIREYDLDGLVRTLRVQNGYHSAVYTADFGGTRRSLSIVSTLFKESTGSCDEYIFAYAQDITPLKDQERRNKQLVDISQQLLSISQTEAVTGLYNRAAGEKLVVEQLESGKSQSAGTMLLLDIDYFKTFNDRYGHQTGDFVLKFFSQTLRDVFRSADILSRWGGDEFVVFMPGVRDRKNVESRIERLRARMRQCTKAGVPFVVTVSIGGALATPGMSLHALFALCDKALYHVKDAGRDGFRLEFR